MKYQLKAICSITKGATGIMKADGGKYPLVALSDERRSHSEFQFDANAVIVPLISSTGHGHASMKRVHYQEGKFALGNILCAVIPNDEKQLNAKYLHLYLQQFKDSLLVPLMKGAANVSLPMNKLAGVEIEVPGLERQLEIIALAEKAEKYKTELEEKLVAQDSDVVKLRKAVLQEAMQGKLVPQNIAVPAVPKEETAAELLMRIKAEKAKPGKNEKPLPPIKPEEIPFQIPENWVWCRLGEIAANIEYGTSQKAEMSSDHIPVLRMNNIQDGKLNFEKLKYVKITIEDLPRLFLKSKDLLFNRTNSWELVGKSGVYHGIDNVMTFASYLIRVQFDTNVSVDFINCYINSSLCRTSQLEPDIIQQNGQANFNGTKLKNIICPLPPLSEQHRIVKKIEQLMQLCDKLQHSIQQSKTENEKLLQGALRDALRNNDNDKKT